MRRPAWLDGLTKRVALRGRTLTGWENHLPLPGWQLSTKPDATPSFPRSRPSVEAGTALGTSSGTRSRGVMPRLRATGRLQADFR